MSWVTIPSDTVTNPFPFEKESRKCRFLSGSRKSTTKLTVKLLIYFCVFFSCKTFFYQRLQSVPLHQDEKQESTSHLVGWSSYKEIIEDFTKRAVDQQSKKVIYHSRNLDQKPNIL